MAASAGSGAGSTPDEGSSPRMSPSAPWGHRSPAPGWDRDGLGRGRNLETDETEGRPMGFLDKLLGRQAPAQRGGYQAPYPGQSHEQAARSESTRLNS